MTPRVSMKLVISRLFSIAIAALRGAVAKAASTAALSPRLASKATLFGASLQTAGAPSRIAAAQVDDRRQHLVVDADRLDAVPCRRHVVGDDEGDGVADVPHRVAGEHRDVRQMPLAAAVVRHRRLAGNVAEMGDVGRRQHQPARRGWRAPPPGR